MLDPIDLLFALFRVELTDTWTLISMIVLMVWGFKVKINDLKAKGVQLDTPVFFYDNGK